MCFICKSRAGKFERTKIQGELHAIFFLEFFKPSNTPHWIRKMLMIAAKIVKMLDLEKKR